MSNLTEAAPPTTYKESTSSGTTTVPITEPLTLNISDLRIGGSVLLAISVIFIAVNGFMIWLVFKNWKTIKRSKFFNSFLLGLVLSFADFTLALLIGFPTSLHLTWMPYFRNISGMRFYSFYIEHFLFEYVFLFRVLVIALLSTDSFLHIQFPLRYDADYESRRRVFIACGVAAAVPLLFRTVPSLVILLKYSDNKTMTCVDYDDPNATNFETLVNASHFYVPLTCGIVLLDENASLVLVDVIILATITILSGLIITATNVTSLLTAFLRIRNNSRTGSDGLSMRQMLKASLFIFFIAFTFVLTNFPYMCIWWIDMIYNEDSSKSDSVYLNNRSRFYLMMLTFLSLVFHPWFFVLRLKSFRDLLKVFKKKFANSILRSSQHITKTSLASPPSKRMQQDHLKSFNSIQMNEINTVYRNEAAFLETQANGSQTAQVNIAAEPELDHGIKTVS